MRVKRSGFRVQGLGFIGFGVWGLGFRVQGHVSAMVEFLILAKQTVEKLEACNEPLCG